MPVLRWLLDRLNPRKLVCEPGVEFELLPRLRVRVWDVFLQVERDELVVNGEVVPLAELPFRHDRFEIARGAAQDTAVVRIVPTPDAAFRGAHEWYCDSECVPVVPFDFEGISIAGPTRISVSESLHNDWDDFTPFREVARFVVAGYYCFESARLRELEASGSIELAIENCATGEVTRQTVDSIIASYRYDVLGINEYPATPPPSVPRDDGFDDDFEQSPVSVGAYFHAPLGHLVGTPDAAFDLRVWAQWGPVRSNVVRIDVRP